MDPRIHFSAHKLAELTERATALTPSEPAPSATVILLRDSPAGPAVYLQKRQSTMVFGGRPVFPGGKVDPADAAAFTAGEAAAEAWAQALGTDAGQARALVVAAARETFEESGYLLAEHRDGTPIVDLDTEQWRRQRDALTERQLSFAELLEHNDLTLRTDWLKPWSVWVTPDIEPKRFHTWFFVAHCPEEQKVLGASAESTTDGWITPADAVRQAHAGELALMPPQLCTFLELYGHPTAEAIMTGEREVIEVRPHLARCEDGTGVLELPDVLLARAAEVGPQILAGTDT